MTELEIIRHAKGYLDKLARGIDPLTDEPVSEDDVVNKKRVSRCLSYVSELLDRVIENGGVQPQRARNTAKPPFALSPEALARYPYGDLPVTVSVIAQRLNELAEPDAVQKLKSTSITGFLLREGLLYEHTDEADRRSRRPTEAGRRLGIATEHRSSRDGDYEAVVYGRDAQRYILDHLDAVSAANSVPMYENSGKPWTPEEDARLRGAYESGASLRTISDMLGRNPSSLRARLRRLGLLADRDTPEDHPDAPERG